MDLKTWSSVDLVPMLPPTFTPSPVAAPPASPPANTNHIWDPGFSLGGCPPQDSHQQREDPVLDVMASPLLSNNMGEHDHCLCSEGGSVSS